METLTLQATLPLRQDGISSRQKKHSKQSSVLSLYKNSATCKCYAPILLHTSFLNTTSVCTRVALLSLLYVPGPGALQRLLCRAPVFFAPILCTIIVHQSFVQCTVASLSCVRSGVQNASPWWHQLLVQVTVHGPPQATSPDLSFALANIFFRLPCRCQQLIL